MDRAARRRASRASGERRGTETHFLHWRLVRMAAPANDNRSGLGRRLALHAGWLSAIGVAILVLGLWGGG